ncbi:MAG: aminoacetone oxidase family FAD-binding enzyme, partial [Bacteroidales bacterium]|nr:aminoacetone oxidase family FAD-binding enzyme [Bacteroidales bacterium]
MANVVIIGGGAAGCFCAAILSELHPGWPVSVLEAGPRLMAKLSVTGGGRCNLTNSFAALCPDSPADLKRVSVKTLEQVYPRGAALMKRALSSFSQWDCCKWFEDHGVDLVVQDDRCVFPRSQDAMQIVRTIERQMRLGGVRIRCRHKVSSIGADLLITPGELKPDAVVLTTGGGTAGILRDTGIELVPPVPSLFTFKVGDESLRALMGTVVEDAALSIAGTRFHSRGTLLLTDWGVSGPATLRLSSYAARYLAENQYKATL